MADFWSGQVGNNYCPQIKLSANVTSYNETSDTITWTLDYVAHGYGFYISGNRTWNVNIDGQPWSGSANVYGAAGTVRLGSGTKVVAKTHSDKNVGCSASMSFNGYWNGAYINWAECSGTVFTGKKTSYTVSYNANGGSGAPGSQTKWHGENITLSATRPSRTSHSFSKWNTNTSGTGTSYNPGSTYSANANATLYAIWSANTYTVSYNANGGSGAPGAQTKTYGKTLTLSNTRPTRTNYNFLGWGTSAGATTVAYNPGSSYTANAGITLYAIWQLAYVLPRISNLTADRCLVNGTIDDSGDKVKVSFSWSTDRSVTAIVIRWRLQSNAVWLSSKTISASGTSGTVSTIINAVFDAEQPYVIEVGVRDSGGVMNAQTTVGTTEYMIDLRKGGKGLAIGAAASQDGLTVGWPAKFNKEFIVNGYLQGQIRRSHGGTSWIKGRDGSSLRTMTGSTNSFHAAVSMKTPNGSWDMGTLGDSLYFSYSSDANYNADNNSTNVIKFNNNGYIAAICIFPVGYIYISTSSTNPGTYFRGTWQQIQGRFLLAASGDYPAGSTGGAASVALTTNQMPVHQHWVDEQIVHGGTNGDVINSHDGGPLNGWDYNPSSTNQGLRRITVPRHVTNQTGSGQAHPNMPPYLSVYMWKRTA